MLQNGEKKKVRPVSRLDRDTSGIILFAKNEFIQEALIKQMKEKIFKKEYVGIVNGIIPEESGTIDLPIARKPDSIMLRHIDVSGGRSLTTFQVIKHLNEATYLKFTLETGRTHQIRVHCQAIGHPLVGETLYPHLNSAKEKSTNLINRQCLHSISISFIHPITMEVMNLSCDIPDDIKSVLNAFQK